MNPKNKVQIGLDQIEGVSIPGKRIGYLGNQASISSLWISGPDLLYQHFGSRLTALFGPQHGFWGEAQDNMIETDHFVHPKYQIPVFSLYGETRIPTKEMLSHIDVMIIDLPDNGTRVYTFLWSMVLTLEACGRENIPAIILDRPNPLGGISVAGNLGTESFKSFIGLFPLPMQHGMTLGELALYARDIWKIKVDLEVVPMKNWQRFMNYQETLLPWVHPSPNFPTLETAVVYPGTVLLEGTCLSEGRGTVKPFEIIGHPALNNETFCERFYQTCKENKLSGFILRPLSFIPTFDKFQDQLCRGFQIHVTHPDSYKSWHTGQLLLQQLYLSMGTLFHWRQPPFEYVEDKLPIDLLNGNDACRKWVEGNGDFEELLSIEQEGMAEFIKRREHYLLYKNGASIFPAG
jgi:uncharacterized protein YbbC (DUF1343 family)